jgi:hypothetical protein
MPSRALLLQSFFSGEDRMYSRAATARLTDLAGLAVVVVLTAYFTVIGLFFYNDLHGAGAAALKQ